MSDLTVLGTGVAIIFFAIMLAFAFSHDCSAEDKKMGIPQFEIGSQNGSDWKTYTSLYVSAAHAANQSARAAQLAAIANASQSLNAYTGWGPFPGACEPDYGPIEYSGIELGETVAWRAWIVKDGFLASATANCFWMPNEPMEGDINKWGVHAFKSYRDAFGSYGRYPGSDTGMVVTGEVYLWGEIVEHEEGYRAQFGRVKSLKNIHPETAESRIELDRLRKLYGVE